MGVAGNTSALPIVSMPGGLPRIGRSPGLPLVPGVGASLRGVGVLDFSTGVEDLSFCFGLGVWGYIKNSGCYGNTHSGHPTSCEFIIFFLYCYAVLTCIGCTSQMSQADMKHT